MKIGIIYSQKTESFLDSKFPVRPDKMWYQKGAMAAFDEAKIPYEQVNEDKLINFSALQQYTALFMENILCVTDEEIATLRKYHLAGGGIVSMFGSTARYADGKLRPDFGLAKEFHVSCGGDPETEQWDEQPFGYICIIQNHPINNGFKIGDILQYSRILVPFWAPRLTVHQGGTAIANLGSFIKNDTGLAALVVSENGKGRCAYSGPSISIRICEPRLAQDTDKLKQLIVNMVRWVCKET